MTNTATFLFVASCVIAISLVPASVTIAVSPDAKEKRIVDFERHVAPLLSKHGCNVGSCHGAAEGKGDFKLSLFGFDMLADYQAMADEDHGRVDLADPAASLLLEKPSLQTDHDGGKRFNVDSVAWNTIHEWIQQGAKHRPGTGTLESLSIGPNRVVFDTASSARPKVIAEFANGTREDVTKLCTFRAQDETVAKFHGDELHSVGPGDTAVIATYRGYPVSMSVLSPRRDGIELSQTYEAKHWIDRLILGKLNILGIEPSPLTEDVEFLRRVTLQTIGQLPSADEVRRFAVDRHPAKREKKIDELLSHPLHASLWATRMCEITGSRDSGSARQRETDDRPEWQWHAWFHKRFADNMSYDELVRDILTATTVDGLDFPLFVRELAEAARVRDDIHDYSEHYAKRQTLDLFWQRPKVNEEIDVDEVTERIAAGFLGVRMECARCHKHPFDRWTQDDHRSLANVFTQVRFGLSPASRAEMVDMLEKQRDARRQGQPVQKIPTVKEVFLSRSSKDRVSASSRDALPPRALGGPELPSDGDRREPFSDWLTDVSNPMFARNFVNRVWQWYFGRGFVEPVDAFSAANPPSHPELLDKLARDFAAHGFDVRRLERMILMSQTWQQTSVPTESNASDRRNFARAYVVPLRAEAIVDAVQKATGTSFGKVARAENELAAAAIPVTRTGNERLDTWFRVFQRPDRELTCDCEQTFEPTLRQTMLLLSDLETDDNFGEGLTDLMNSKRTNEMIIDELFLRTLSRWPNIDEKQAALDMLKSTDRLAAGKDILWSLINTREFATIH